MTVRVVATLEADPDQSAAAEIYFSTAFPLMEKAGGSVVEQFDVGDAVVGEKVGTSIMIIEYPDLAAVDAVFGSDIYASVIPQRDLAFKTYNINIIVSKE